MNDLTRSYAPSDDSLVGRVAGEFTERLQRGEVPDVEEYAARHPHLAALLRQVLPALQALRPASGGAAPPTEALPGFLGDFRILRQVGQGGMGVVYEAEQISLHRRVALKVLPFAAGLDARQLQRFKNEAQAAAGLHHAHIVPVFAVGAERGVHYYAMQFIEGHTLADLIRERRHLAGVGPSGGVVPADAPPVLVSSPGNGRHAGARRGSPDPAAAGPRRGASDPAGPTRPSAGLPTDYSSRSRAYIRTAAALGVQAAEALEHAHQLGVVHRDIKPANLLVDGDGHLWVTDFGLARLHRQDAGLTLTGDLIGTLRYMSPEQARAGRTEVDHRTDVYSLGVTLYELLTLQPAFPAAERTELLQQLLTADPLPVRRLNKAVPAELETVIHKAIAKAPEERYATAQELADDLRRFLDDQPIRARRPGPVQRARKWVRRHRLLVASLGAALALIAVAAVAGAFLYADEQRRLASEVTALCEKRAELAKQAETERRDSEDHLGRALLAKAAGVRRSRQPGYRRAVWEDLRHAARLDVPSADPDQIRAEVVACLGDPIGLDPPPLESVSRQPRPEFPAALASWCLSPSVNSVRRQPRPELPAAFARLIREPKLACSNARAVTHDGKRLALAFANKVQLLDPEGKVLGELRAPLGYIHALAFTPDGRLLAAGSDEGLLLWTVPELRQHAFFRSGSILSLAIHPRGNLLAVGGRKLELWSITSGRPLVSFDNPVYGAAVEFSPQGDYLLAVVSGRVRAAWPIRDTPEKRYLDGHEGGVPALAFSPDGRFLASAGKDRVVTLWDAATGERVRSCTGHRAGIEALAFSPDGRLLATGDFGGWVHVWKVETGQEVGRLEGPGGLWRLQFDPAGRYLVAGGAFGLQGWALARSGDRTAAEPLFSFSGFKVVDLAVSPDGARVVFPDGTGNLFRYEIDLAAGPFPLHLRSGPTVRGLHFEPGGRLVFVREDGTIGTWGGPRGVPPLATNQKGFHLAVSPGGRWVATSSPTHEALVYDLAASRAVLTLPPESGEVWSLAWSPDGTRLAVGVSDGGVAIWDLRQVQRELTAFGLPSAWEPTPAAGGGSPAEAGPSQEELCRIQAWRAGADVQEASAAFQFQVAGDAAAARECLLRCLRCRQQLANQVAADGYHVERLAHAEGLLAEVAIALDDHDAANRHHDRQDALVRQLLIDYPGVAAYRAGLADSHRVTALLLESAERYPEALGARREEVVIREELAARPPSAEADRASLAVAQYQLAEALRRDGRLTDAERAYRRARDVVRPLATGAAWPCMRAACEQALAACQHGLGTTLEEAGRWQDAEATHRQALAGREKLCEAYHLPSCESDLALSLERLGVLRRHQGRYAEATRFLWDALCHQAIACKACPQQAVYRQRYGQHLRLLSASLAEAAGTALARTTLNP